MISSGMELLYHFLLGPLPPKSSFKELMSSEAVDVASMSLGSRSCLELFKDTDPKLGPLRGQDGGV